MGGLVGDGAGGGVVFEWVGWTGHQPQNSNELGLYDMSCNVWEWWKLWERTLSFEE